MIRYMNNETASFANHYIWMSQIEGAVVKLVVRKKGQSSRGIASGMGAEKDQNVVQGVLFTVLLRIMFQETHKKWSLLDKSSEFGEYFQGN